MIAAIVIHVLNNFESLKDNQGILFYVPKIETWKEAQLVSMILKSIEEEIGAKRGTLKIEMLHERALFTAQQELIMWVLRENLIGANVGRWDYINSLLEMNKDSGETYMDPHRFGMTSFQLTTYTRRNALLTILAGGFPIGGMAALMKNSVATEAENNKAINDIWFDKLRERLTGFMVINGQAVDAYRQSWVATTEKSYVSAGAEALVADRKDIPALVARASDDQKAILKKLHLINDKNEITPLELKAADMNVNVLWSEQSWTEIANPAKGEITEEGLRYSIYMASEYMFQQLNGNNAAAINIREGDDKAIRLMNDFATYEIFWHWLWTAYHNRAELTQDGKSMKKGEKVTWKLVKRLLDERTVTVRKSDRFPAPS
jgi:malate synthase